MIDFRDFIIEKLHISKNTRINIFTDLKKLKEVVDNFLHDFYKYPQSSYEIRIEKSDEVYIEILLKNEQDNTKIHDIGYLLFTKLFDEEYCQKYQHGSDWWVSRVNSSKKVVIQFALK